MASEGRHDVRVGELIRAGALALNDGYRVRNIELGPVGIPFVRGGDIGDGDINTDVADRIRPEFAQRVQSKLTQPWDVAFITKGTVGRVGILRPDQPQSVFAPQVCYWRSLDHQRLEPRFLFYLLRSSAFQSNLDAVKTHGSMAADYVSLSDQRSFLITVPEIEQQRAIASVLGTLDDRIDLLRQTNTTLEAIAKALFKSWFVDFDPVRAKAEGREPEGVDAATAAVFPSEFEESELGLIPKGWSVQPFGSQFDFTMGQSPPGSTYNEHKMGVPFFQGCTDFGDVFPAERIYCSEPTRFARAGDLLMSVRAPVGALNIATVDCSIGRGLCGIRHKSGSTGLTYQFLKAHVSRIENAAGEGALFRSLSKQQLATLPILAVEGGIAASLIAIIEPTTDRMVAAAKQANQLAALRDALLPRLISGKLRLPEVEATIEAAIA